MSITMMSASAPRCAVLLPPAPSLPDLCRRAVRLLDDYAAARETALRCAAAGQAALASRKEIRSLYPRIAALLCAVADHEDGDSAGNWYARAGLLEDGVVEPDAWGVELLTLAATCEARATAPESGPLRDTEPGVGPAGGDRE